MTVGSGQSAVGRQKAGGGRRLGMVLSAFCLLPAACCLPGCGGDSKPGESGYDRSEKALHDPMRYSPYSTGAGKSDMSGVRGGTTAADAKDAKDAKDSKSAAAGSASGGKDDNGTSDWDGLKRDLKHVFDP